MIRYDHLEKLKNLNDSRMSHEQKAMAEHHAKEGFEVFIEEYSDYTYIVLIKVGARNSPKRLNRTGHDVYVGTTIK